MRAFLIVAGITIAVQVLVRIAAAWLPDRAWDGFAAFLASTAIVGSFWCAMSAWSTGHMLVGFTWLAVLSLYVGRLANGGA